MISNKAFNWPPNVFGPKIKIDPTQMVLEQMKEIEELITAEYSGEVLSSFFETRKKNIEDTFYSIENGKYNIKKGMKALLDNSTKIVDKFKTQKRNTSKTIELKDTEIIKYYSEFKENGSDNEDLIKQVKNRIDKYNGKEKIRYLNLLTDDKNVVYNFYIFERCV